MAAASVQGSRKRPFWLDRRVSRSVLALSAPTQQYGILGRLAAGAPSRSQLGLFGLRHRRRDANFPLQLLVQDTFSCFHPAPAPISFPQRTFVPGRVRLTSFTDPSYDAPWAAARAMAALDAPRAKRIRTKINYAEPTELDEDIAADDEPSAVTTSDEPPSDAEHDATDIGSDSGSDEEFTTDKVTYLNA